MEKNIKNTNQIKLDLGLEWIISYDEFVNSSCMVNSGKVQGGD